MNTWLCFSMAESATTGRIWSFLHLLPLLLFSLGIGLVLTRNAMIALRTNSRRWMYDSTTMTPVSRVMKNVLKILSAGERSVEKRLGLKVWTEEEEARNMREQLEKHIPSKEGRGWAKWIPVWLCLVFGLGAVWMLRPAKVTTEYNVAVTAVWGPYRYTFQPVDETNHLIGQEFTEDICQDYPSPQDDFKEGIILWKLIHTVENGCWSLNPEKHAGYYKRRDRQKQPTFVTEVAHGY
jgi:hypothetical protein